METRRFGKSDLETSVIGFGGWPMSMSQYGPVDEREAIAAVHRAMDMGVTLFDTAAVYGWGAGEEVMGRALKGRRDKVVLVTKGGRKWVRETNERANDSSRAFLEKGLEESLRRLQTDYVDLCLIHWPDTSRPFREPMEVFAGWKKQGKIRYGGVSNFSPAQMSECLKHFPIACDQMGYNLFDRRAEAELLPFCRKQGLGVMTYGSLSYGLLAGAMTKDVEFDPDDWRFPRVAFGLPIFQGEYLWKNLETVQRLKEIASGHGKTVAQLAIAWVLANPAVTVALTGIRRPAEIEENVGAAGWHLTPQVKAEIEAAFRVA